jgi:hypothetical protein
MRKYDYIALRRKLYDVCGSLGTAAETEDKSIFEEAYIQASNALDILEQYGIDMGYLESETLEIKD